jgi:hypothetical protein
MLGAADVPDPLLSTSFAFNLLKKDTDVGEDLLKKDAE